MTQENKFRDESRDCNSWKWLNDLKIDQSELIREGRMSTYVIARRLGIKVTVRKQPNGDLKVTRIK